MLSIDLIDIITSKIKMQKKSRKTLKEKGGELKWGRNGPKVTHLDYGDNDDYDILMCECECVCVCGCVCVCVNTKLSVHVTVL